MARKRTHSGNTVGAWAVKKLDALENYLSAYTRVLKNQAWCETIYVDAFAGAGSSRLRQAQQTKDNLLDQKAFELLDVETIAAVEEYVHGSPLRALSIPFPFDKYFFFDSDPVRALMLEELKQKHVSLKIDVRVGDANALIAKLIPEIKRYNRVFAFLDPYGPQLDWKTVSALAHTEVVEVLINLPIHMAINRMLPNSGDVPENWVGEISRVFGSDEWRGAAYISSKTLMGERLIKAENASEQLLQLYHRNLGKMFKYVSVPRLVRNTRMAPLYYLIWAGQNVKGFEIADYILRQGEYIQFGAQRDLF